MTLTCLVSPRAILLTPGDLPVDVTDATALSRAVKNVEPDIIVHLAGASGAACDAEPDLARAVNVKAMEVLCDAATFVGTSRIVFTSTAAVYGDTKQFPVRETEPLDLRSTYARMKFEAEEILRRSSTLTSLTTVALRVFNIYGPGFVDSLVHRLMAATPATPARLQGMDGFVRDYVQARDVAAAIVAAAQEPLVGHLAVNVGSGRATSNRRLVEILGRQHPLNYELADSRLSYSCADITLAREKLRFTPETLENVLNPGRTLEQLL